MIRRQNVNKASKPLKSSIPNDDCCSRVGTGFQAEIPAPIRFNARNGYPPCPRELNVWSPGRQPIDGELQSYLDLAKQYKYPVECAMTLLHWHDYNISDASDDLPNYIPVSNKWSKCEIKKFLKCIDSKPRKNFVVARKSMPGRRMGEISQMYYSIAAPFKARAKGHRRLIDNCISRAVRNNLIAPRWPSSDEETIRCRVPGESADPLERQFELHMIDLHGMAQTKKLLGRRMLSTLPPSDYDAAQPASPSRNNANPVANHFSGHSSSSGTCSQVGNDSLLNGQSDRYRLPPGIHFDYSEFLEFLKIPEEQLQKERELELSSCERLDAELMAQVQAVENRAQNLLSDLEKLKPSTGFPQISYRWTKTELALVLMAMSQYGTDFATIAKILGSKTESFIRDFYNHARRAFPLDDIIRLSNKLEHMTVDTEPIPETSPEPVDQTSPLPNPRHNSPSPLQTIKLEPDTTTAVSDEASMPSSSQSSAPTDDKPLKVEPSVDVQAKPLGKRKRGRPARFRDTTAMDVTSLLVTPPVKRGRGRAPRIRNT